MTQNMEKFIASILLDKGAVQINAKDLWTWKSGIESPIYCDCRILPSFVDAISNITNAFIAKIKDLNLDFDCVNGVVTGGIPWAAFIARKMGKPMIYTRPEPKKHGTGKQVEGVVQEGSKILMIEDLISTGGSSIKAALACAEECKSEIVGVMSIFSYELEKAKVNFADAGIPFHSLSNLSVLIEQSDIPDAEKKIVLDFQKTLNKQ